MSLRGAGAAELVCSTHSPDPPIGGEPAVTVIIPSYNSRETIAECLRSLQNQAEAGVFEIIVVDSSTDGTAELIARQFPEVRLYTFSERKFPGDARNFGIAKARGDVFALTDADCRVTPHWIREIVAAHERPDPVIGGAVANGNPQSYAGWAYYLCEFSQWLPGTPSRTMTEIPTCCLSVKRWAFDRHGPFLEGTYCSDSAFQWKVAEAGHRPVFLPAVQVWHTNVSRLGKFLIHEMFHGEAFARVRVVERNLTWP
ncbi:MAG TPA: glycosyltransferase, partial [Gemmataceae bacterium]|nr:glycosyltransferase [Gemmataceae bacterium]